MKSGLRKKLLFLNLFILIGLSVVLIVKITNKPSVTKYVALGDSIGTGTILGGKTSSYVEQYASYLKVSDENYVNLCTDGYTSSDVYNNLINKSSIAANATNVTITMGGNNLIKTTMSAIANIYGVDPKDTAAIQQNVINDPEAKIKMARLIIDSGLVLSLSESVTKFNQDLQNIVSKIKTDSPKATIYINTVYNPFKETDIFYSIFEPFIDDMNKSIRDNKECKIVDVYTLVKNNPSLIYFDMGTNSFDPHPTQEGQNDIYNLLTSLQ